MYYDPHSNHLDCVPMPVSYTHLDVYKRQVIQQRGLDIKKNDWKCDEAAEIKFLRSVAGQTLRDDKNNDDIRKEYFQ